MNEVLLVLTPTIAVIISFVLQQIGAKRNKKAIDEIHILVNSRLTEALDKIAAFEKRLSLPPGSSPKDPGAVLIHEDHV